LCILGQNQPQTKHEIGHVQFRGLGENALAKILLQLFRNTGLSPSGIKDLVFPLSRCIERWEHRFFALIYGFRHQNAFLLL
jgi:hypothetical protein